MNILSRIPYESKLCPGLTVTFRRFTVQARADFQSSISNLSAEVREIQRARKPLDDEYQAAIEKGKAAAKVKVDALIEAEGITRAEAEARVQPEVDFPDDKFAEWAKSMDEQARIEKPILARAMLRALVVKIDGLEIDDEPATVDGIIDAGNVALTDELADAAKRVMGLTPTESGESLWLGISQQVAGGPSQPMTAPPAESAPEQS